MKNSKFHVGQRVRLIETPYDARGGHGPSVGMLGKVVKIGDVTGDLGIEFDESFHGGHNCLSSGKNGHCWYVDANRCEAADGVDGDFAPGIKLYAEGKTTVAITRRCGDKHLGAALCSPSDEFDYGVGCVIALARALDRDPVDICELALEKLGRHSTKAPVDDGAAHGVLVFCNELATPVGLKTPFHDRRGFPICTGDIVNIYNKNGNRVGTEFMFREEDNRPLHPLVRLALGAMFDGKEQAYRDFYVLGLNGSCNNKTGEFEDGWSVEVVTPWTALSEGSRADDDGLVYHEHFTPKEK